MKMIEMYSIIYVTWMCAVIGSATTTTTMRKNDYEISQNTNLIEDKDLIMRDDQSLEDNRNVKDINCFCNLPICAAKNFVCTTNNQTGGCFSEIHHSESEVGLPKRHGCIEFLKKSTSDLVCDNVPRKHVLAPQVGEILVLCCQNNLCNYQHYENNQKSKDTTTTLLTSTNNDFYFKIAVIIVPILGVIIVALLIILAIKMLKSDGMDPHLKQSIDNLGQQYKVGAGGYGVNAMHVEEGLTGADNETHMSLLCQANAAVCDKKNENLAVRNHLLSLEYTLLPNSYQDSNIKLLNTEEGVLNNLYSKNFKAPPCAAGGAQAKQNITNEVKNGDKIYDKELLNPVVVNWKSNIRNKINVNFTDNNNDEQN